MFRIYQRKKTHTIDLLKFYFFRSFRIEFGRVRGTKLCSRRQLFKKFCQCSSQILHMLHMHEKSWANPRATFLSSLPETDKAKICSSSRVSFRQWHTFDDSSTTPQSWYDGVSESVDFLICKNTWVNEKTDWRLEHSQPSAMISSTRRSQRLL